MKDRLNGSNPSIPVGNDRLIVPGRGLIRPRLEPVAHPEVAGLEIVQINPFVKAVDVRSILAAENPFWVGEVTEIAKAAPEITITGGRVATSLVSSDFKTYYQPTHGLDIKEKLPWLYRLFKTDFRYLVERAAGDPSLHLGEDLESSLNMNLTREGGYEQHIDRNPITALLGVTTIEEGEGGMLRVHERLDTTTKRPAGRYYDVRPAAGILYIFDGLTHPHEVIGLRRNAPRLVIPADYYSDSVPDIKDSAFNAEIGVKANA